MNDKQFSRRDWFRLRTKATSTSSDLAQSDKHFLGHETATGNHRSDPGLPETSRQLTEIELPPNHDGMDLNQLPPMREALLGIEQIAALFSDIAEFAAEIQLMQRKTGQGRAVGANVSTSRQLQAAKSALLEGQVPRIQIRYRWQNALWIDTLTRKERQFQLVRIRHETVG